MVAFFIVHHLGVSMFIQLQQRPCIEFSTEEGQTAPMLVHYLSDRSKTFRPVLRQLMGNDGSETEAVILVESPLSELVDETIRVHRAPEWPDRVIIDAKARPFFEAVKSSLAEALAKIEQIEFAAIEDEDDLD